MTTKGNLTKFAKHITEKTGIRVVDKYVMRYGGWCNVCFDSLDCEQMELLGRYIRMYFSREGLYTHKLVRIYAPYEHDKGQIRLCLEDTLMNCFVKNDMKNVEGYKV